MKKVFVLYNPKSGKETGETQTKRLDRIMDYKLEYRDITKIENYKMFFREIGDAPIIISGGDGTLSHFATDICDIEINNPIYYYATGSGNDFLNDMEYKKGEKPLNINDYLEDLPSIAFNGKEYRFINGAGGGLDAYACDEGNKLHNQGKEANYVATAIKGILYDYKPMNARVTVDGTVHEFKNVWFASVMKGRYFGGGIMLAPNQDRKSGKLSLVVVHTLGRLRILPIIPGAFSGKHVKYTKYVTVIEGNNIEVEFDRPVPLQIDGETFSDINGYSVSMEENRQDLERELIS